MTTAAPAGPRCPICGKPTLPAKRPFCSKRCADVDLHRWLGGVYAIPAEPESDEDGDGSKRPEDDDAGALDKP